MIELNNVTFRYKGSEQGGVSGLSLSVRKGETVLLCGASGAGKTTVLRLINGLIPHYYKGEMEGTVEVGGTDIGKAELHDLAGVIGTVFQNPRSQFFSVDTDGEVVFGLENTGVPRDEILRRKRIITEEMDLAPLLGRSLFELSGGEKQKIACASVAALFPDVILLDEPSSNLDWRSMSALRRIIRKWKEQGKTVLISEHRLWYVMDLADRVLFVKDGRISGDWSIGGFRALSVPEYQELELRPSSIEESFAEIRPGKRETEAEGDVVLRDYLFRYEKKQHFFRRKEDREAYTLSIPELSLPRGHVVGLIGSNGAGKSTLLRCICGLEKSCRGRIELDGKSYSGKKALSVCYLVMQDVNHQLFTDSVETEVMLSMKSPDRDAAGEILADLGLEDYADTHPMALSGGQKQRVAIASAIAAEAELLLFDEPTSGLDYLHMSSVASLLKKLASAGRTVLVSTHDPELLTMCADDIVHIENGAVEEQYALGGDTLEVLKEFFLKQTEQ